MKKSTVKNVQPEQLLNSEQKTRNSTSPPAIANTGVVRSPKSRTPELIFARKMYLCVQLLGGQSDILSTLGVGEGM